MVNQRVASSLGLAAGLVILATAPVLAAPAVGIPSVQIGINSPQGPQQLATSLQILLLLTVLTLAPAILVLMTSFTRIVIVLSFVRSALATQQTPPNQVIIGLALFLTFFVMSPVFSTMYNQAWVPYSQGQLSESQMIQTAEKPLKSFMLRQTRKTDLQLFEKYNNDQATSTDQLSIITVVPAFAISELQTAFQMGFVIFLPFIVIDMVVASTLMSMGMLMLPPMIISLPFKILLFVLVDGWHLVVQALLQSFH